MSGRSEHNAAPDHFGRAHPYGADQPAAAGPMLDKILNNPEDELIFIGEVTDCSTHSYSCTVTIPNKTAGAGFPCLWAAGGIHRFGGCSDACPPEVGSLVAVYKQKGSNFGMVLGQIAGLVDDLEEVEEGELQGSDFLDPLQAVNAFRPDTGMVMSEFGFGGSALNGFERMPNDVFPGDRLWMNELGAAMGVLRTMALLKGSELAKVEAFVLDDLLKIVGRNMDVFFGGGYVQLRDEYGLPTSELYHSFTAWEALGILSEKETEAKSGPVWRLRAHTGWFGDLKRQFVSFPAEFSDKSINPLGVADRMDSSDGLVVERTVAGGGVVKSRQVGVPERVRRPEAIDGSDAENHRPLPEGDDLSDFFWQYEEHGDVTVQMRDALAWIIGRQGNARLHPFGEDGDNPDWKLQDEADVGLDKGNKGADTGAGGYFREMLDQVVVNELDVTGLTKPRVIRVNDSWIFILPDGSITIRDGMGACWTMTRGHITQSAPKDVNVIAGRDINLKAGHDINVNARMSVDVTAGEGQARVYARKSAFFHSEDGGILLSTNAAGYKSEVTKEGEELDVGGIILKPHADADVVVETRSMYVQAREKYFIGGPPGYRPDVYFEARQTMYKVDQAHWQLGGSRYVQFVNGIDTDGNINTEANVYALFGTMKMNTTHEEHKNSDFCNYPADGYQILVDRLEPIYENLAASGQRSIAKRNPPRQKCGAPRDDSDASNDSTFDWSLLHGNYGRAEIGELTFSLRTETDYGTDVDDFSWTEQPWMREWSGTNAWGRDASTTGPKGETWCYPGTKYWTGGTGFTTYDEANVNPNGDPKKRDELKKEGGTFKKANLQKMKRHP